MPDFIDERSGRLHSACSNMDAAVRAPLLFGTKLGDAANDALLHYTMVYLYDSLQLAGPGRYEFGPDMLDRYAGQVRSLPNVTPNGLLLPKRHNLLAYNMLCRHIASVVLGFRVAGAERWHFPVNVRIVDGAPNPAVDSRPRASVKLHSDIWAGEFTNHVMLFFPVLGDMSRNGVSLFEPGPSFYPSFVRTVDDYGEGAHLIDDATDYGITMEAGHAYFLDSFLLHRTNKGGSGLRLAINFAFLTEGLLPSDREVTTGRHDEYIGGDEWFGQGTEWLVHTGEAARSFSSAETSAVANRYAGRYGRLSL